ncbi:MAG TPA: hypothetical protein VKB88_43030 [Bryobacteraceae bacterium]|nr:hypothetical protein [Bryobacteraceae bacterium]
MAVTRRDLLRMGPVLIAAASVPVPIWADSGTDTLARLSRSSFEPCVNSSFETVDSRGSRSWFTLTSVVDATNLQSEANRSAWAVLPKRPAVAPPNLDCFLLTFYGPPGLTQDTYTLTHTSLGTFPLLLVPGETSSYVAVINRLVGRQLQA